MKQWSNQDKKEQKRDDGPTVKKPHVVFKPLPQQEAFNQSFRPKQLNFAQQIPQHEAPERLMNGSELADVLDIMRIRLQSKEITEDQAKAEVNQLLQYLQEE